MLSSTPHNLGVQVDVINLLSLKSKVLMGRIMGRGVEIILQKVDG